MLLKPERSVGPTAGPLPGALKLQYHGIWATIAVDVIRTGSSPPLKNALAVFLCHSSADKPSIRDLHRRLTSDGVDAWLDEICLLPGQDWDLEIQRAIRRSQVVLVCLSASSLTKEGYVQREIKRALDLAEEKPEGTIFVIPVRLEAVTVPDRLRQWQWVNLFDPDGYDRLLSSCACGAKRYKLTLPKQIIKCSPVPGLVANVQPSRPNLYAFSVQKRTWRPGSLGTLW